MARGLTGANVGGLQRLARCQLSRETEDSLGVVASAVMNYSVIAGRGTGCGGLAVEVKQRLEYVGLRYRRRDSVGHGRWLYRVAVPDAYDSRL